MKKLVRCLCIAFALAAMVVPAWTTPSLLGPSGTGALPTAEIANTGTITVAGDYLDIDDTTLWRAVYGFGDSFEISGAYVDMDASIFSLSAKYKLMATENSQTAVGVLYGNADGDDEPIVTTDSALRADDMGFEGDTDVWQIYAAHTVSLMPETETSIGLIGTVGANWTDISDVDDALRFFASVEAKKGPASLAAEYQTKKSAIESDPIFSFVARYKFANGFAAQAGWTNSFGIVGWDESRFFGGVSYTFGGL